MEYRGGNRMLSILASETLRCFFLLLEKAGGDRGLNLATSEELQDWLDEHQLQDVSLPGSLWLYPVLLQLSQKATAHWWDGTVVCLTSVISAIISQHLTYVSPWKSVFIDLQPKSAKKLEHTQENIWELYNPQTFSTPMPPLLSEAELGERNQGWKQLEIVALFIKKLSLLIGLEKQLNSMGKEGFLTYHLYWGYNSQTRTSAHLKCSLMTFTEFIQLCNLHHNLSYYFSSMWNKEEEKSTTVCSSTWNSEERYCLPVVSAYLYWNLIKF